MAAPAALGRVERQLDQPWRTSSFRRYASTSCRVKRTDLLERTGEGNSCRCSFKYSDDLNILTIARTSRIVRRVCAFNASPNGVLVMMIFRETHEHTRANRYLASARRPAGRLHVCSCSTQMPVASPHDQIDNGSGPCTPPRRARRSLTNASLPRRIHPEQLPALGYLAAERRCRPCAPCR